MSTHFQREEIPAGEDGQIAEIAELTKKLLRRRYPEGPIKRGVHPKAHGCVRCQFRVSRKIDPRFRIGVFSKPGRAYRAWMRYSNATSLEGPDVNEQGHASSRGCALKLQGVKGETLLGGGRHEQDFLMINLPVFAFANVEEYLRLTRTQFEQNEDITSFLPSAGPNTMPIIGEIFGTQLGNPVDAAYFTASPFALGSEMAVKYGIFPTELQGDPVPESPSPDYLREALERTFDPKCGRPLKFDLRVQVRTSASEDQPIEDATVKWSEEAAPFVKIGRIRVEPQDIARKKRIKKCERLVFSPWNGLVEHRPLGGINRLRKAVYLASSGLRKGGE